MQLRTPQNSKLFQFIQLMQLSGKENDPRALKALKLIQLDESNYQSPFVQSVIKELTQRISGNAITGENPNPYRHEQGMNVCGPLELGRVVYSFNEAIHPGPVFGLYPIELTCPTYIAGGTGSGKTNFGIYGIASEIHRFNKKFKLENNDRIGCFFLQTVKLDEAYVYNINDDIIFLDSDTLRINPLSHEGHNKEQVFQHFIKLAGEVLFFREGSANQISVALEKIDQRNNGNPFSVYDLYEEIKKLPKTRYEGVLDNRFAGLLSNKSGKIFDCLKGTPLEKISHEFVIINLTDLDFYSQQFISIFIYQYLTEHFKNQPKQKLNTVLFYDEGDHIFSRHAEQAMIGYPTASSLFTTSRSSGIGAVVITHQPHKVITSLRSEAYTKIIFNLSDAEDAKYMAQACSLTKEEQDMISKLPNYHAIVSTRRCSKPFIIRAFNRADELRKKPIEIKDKTRQKIAELQKSVIPRAPLRESIQVSKYEDRSLAKSIQESPAPYFELNIMKLIENIFLHPFLATVERYRQLGFSASKGNTALKTLEEKKLAQRVTLKFKKGRGGTASFIELTREGLMKIGKSKQPYKGKGSLKHAFYARKVAEFYEEQGFETKQELGCDVAVSTPQGPIAIEICIHTSNIAENIQRNEKNGFIKTILVFESKDSMEKAGMHASEKIELNLIDFYLE